MPRARASAAARLVSDGPAKRNASGIVHPSRKPRTDSRRPGREVFQAGDDDAHDAELRTVGREPHVQNMAQAGAL